LDLRGLLLKGGEGKGKKGRAEGGGRGRKEKGKEREGEGGKGPPIISDTPSWRFLEICLETQ